MSNRRQHARTPFQSAVKLIHPSLGCVTVTTRDVSDGGLFLLTKDMPMPPVGSIVQIQALAFGESAPILKAKIVRATPDGVGLMFCS